METEYAGQTNTKPVIYFSFKDCSNNTSDGLRIVLNYEGLEGEIWCIGLARNKKDCDWFIRSLFFDDPQIIIFESAIDQGIFKELLETSECFQKLWKSSQVAEYIRGDL